MNAKNMIRLYTKKINEKKKIKIKSEENKSE